jgi:hypothetical protein
MRKEYKLRVSKNKALWKVPSMDEVRKKVMVLYNEGIREAWRGLRSLGK